MIRIRSEKERMKKLANNIIRGLTSEEEDVEIDSDDLLFIVEKAHENVVGEGLTTPQGKQEKSEKTHKADRKQKTASESKTNQDTSNNKDNHPSPNKKKENKEYRNDSVDRSDNGYSKSNDEIDSVKKAVETKKAKQQSNAQQEKDESQGFFGDIPEPEDIGSNSNHPDFSSDEDNNIINEPL